AGMVAAASTGDVEPALVALLQAASIQAGDRDLAALAGRVQESLALPTAGEIVEELARVAGEDSAFAPLAATLATRSPTSLEAILQIHRAARRLSSVEAVLALDRRLASYMVRHPDFVEGVRAQLVDRDRR